MRFSESACLLYSIARRCVERAFSPSCCLACSYLAFKSSILFRCFTISSSSASMPFSYLSTDFSPYLRLFELVFIDEFSPRNDRLTSAKLLSSPAVSKSNDIERPEIRSAILYLLSEQIKKPHIVAVIVEQELTARKSGNKRLFFFRFVSFFHEIHDKSKRHIHYVVYLHAIFHQISYKIVHVFFLLFRCKIF